MRLIAMGVGESKARPATYPLLVTTPPSVTSLEPVDGELRFRVRQLVRVASFAGLFPLLTFPVHDEAMA